MDNKQSKKKHNKRASYIWTVCALLFLICAIAVAGSFALSEYNRWKSEAIYNELAANNEATTEVVTEIVDSTVVPTETEYQETPLEAKIRKIYEQYGITVPDKKIDFDKLNKEVSEDIYAWIYIPDTNVNYPVLQHPTDNTYYLEYNINGSKGYPGCIYTENYNNKNFTDRHTVIYGHNMRNGIMFSDLHYYEDGTFFEENPYIYIYVKEDILVYKIFAAYESGNTHLLLGYDHSEDRIFLNYLEYVLQTEGENSHTDKTVQFEANDKILTLSTCVMEESQKHIRYLVQGVLLDVE